MREPGRLEPFARPGTNPDDDEASGITSADVAAQILSPMKSLLGVTPTIFLDNANTKGLPAPFVTNDLDTDNFNGFAIPKLTGPLVVPVPKTPSIGFFEGRKITLQITSRGTPADTVTLTGGVGGFLWPTVGIGPFQTDFDDTLAAMGNDDVILVGCQYHTSKNRWLVNALAGPYT